MRLFEIVQLSLSAWTLIPDTGAVGLKKSKMLLLSMRLPVFGLPAVPRPITALVGRFVPAGPMLQNEMLLLLLTAPVVVLKNTVPPAPATAEVDEPSTVHRVMMLFCAPLIKRIVLVLPDVPVLEIVSELPPVLSPPRVTLSAPLRPINALPVAIAPEMVRGAPPVGCIRTDV